MWWFDDLVLGYTGSSFWHYLTSIYDIYVEWLRTVVIVHYNLSSKEARIGQHEIAVIRYGVIDHGETRRLLLPKFSVDMLNYSQVWDIVIPHSAFI